MEFGDEFTPVSKLSKEELNEDVLLKQLKQKQNVRKEETAKKRTATLNFFQSFKLSNTESKKRKLDESEDQMDQEDVSTHQDTSIDNKSHSSADVEFIKKTIKRQLLNPILDTPQVKELFNIMQNTVRDNEGTSTVLIGPKSCGKTTLINQCIAKLNDLYPDQFFVIRLNSFIHNDDISAIREIATQLNVFLKSHGHPLNIESRQINNAFKQVLSILESDVGVSFIFIIDNLEDFTTGNKQVLLYNLLDITTNSKSVCVIGTSTKFTTRELLEKRVRSRFSQRLIIMNKISNIDSFTRECLKGFKLSEEDQALLDNMDYGIEWNRQFDEIGSNLKKLIIMNFNTVRSIKVFNNSMFLPLSMISTNSPLLDDERITLKPPQNYIESLIKSLSTTEILLAIACARVIEKSNLSALNFNLSYQEYTAMMKEFNESRTILKTSSIANHAILNSVKVTTKIWNADIMKNCWMALYRLGLLIEYVPNTVERGIATGNSNKYFMLDDNKMCQLDISLMELNTLVADKFKTLTKL
ncbi:origin recognition complex subunit 4 [[Candida] jaroonii]|uniref:Origin recognition complex subunit 4 n=1 Tax=[Candida] jaroonii TaxID=467808 RepID=A0ACA9Y6C3_9ASCO|nr:origin recognition complex subunit 4 [[Candida] jaroonii]